MLLHWSDPPLITVDDFRDPPLPNVYIFQANLSGRPPLNPSKVFSDPPFWVLSYNWSPLLFSQVQWVEKLNNEINDKSAIPGGGGRR